MSMTSRIYTHASQRDGEQPHRRMTYRQAHLQRKSFARTCEHTFRLLGNPAQVPRE